MIHGSSPHPTTTGRSSAAALDAQEAFDRGVRFEQRDELIAAEEAFRAADDLGHATAAVRLGVLLEESDDFHGAEQAFRRADARGDAVGAFHLAWMLQEGGDLAAAEQAYRRAESRGHPGAHSNLRMMRAAHAIGLPAPAEPAAAEPVVEVAPEPEPAPAPRSEPTARRGPADEVPPPRAHAVPSPPAPVAPEVISGGEVVDEPSAARRFGAEPEISSEAADQLAIALAAMSGQAAVTDGEHDLTDLAAEQPTMEFARPLRAVPRSEAIRARNARPGESRAPQVAAEPGPQRAGRARRKQREKAAPAPAGLARRVLGVVLPVVAFGAAFSAGASSRNQTPIPASLAPAVRLSGADVRLAPVSSVPSPAALPKPRPPAKPKTGLVNGHTSTSDRAVVVPLPPTTGRTVRVRTGTHGAATTGGTSVKSTTTRAGG